MPREWDPRVARTWVWLGIVTMFVALVALILEFAGLAVSDDETPPLTQILSRNVSGWIVIPVCAAIAGFGAWLVWHFWETYADLRRARARARAQDNSW